MPLIASNFMRKKYKKEEKKLLKCIALKCRQNKIVSIQQKVNTFKRNKRKEKNQETKFYFQAKVIFPTHLINSDVKFF